ncbi:hypothetical protein FQR65_LT18575 [Abscondita terminalis]|nr:hypothetical protein FQR65_LT18575 [Abscondita terminalis]
MEKYRKDKLKTFGLDKDFIARIDSLSDIQLTVAGLNIITGEITKLNYDKLENFSSYIKGFIDYTKAYREKLIVYLKQNNETNARKIMTYFDDKLSNLIKIEKLIQQRKINIERNASLNSSIKFNTNNSNNSPLNTAQLETLAHLRNLSMNTSNKTISAIQQKYTSFRKQNSQLAEGYNEFLSLTQEANTEDDINSVVKKVVTNPRNKNKTMYDELFNSSSSIDFLNENIYTENKNDQKDLIEETTVIGNDFFEVETYELDKEINPENGLNFEEEFLIKDNQNTNTLNLNKKKQNSNTNTIYNDLIDLKQPNKPKQTLEIGKTQVINTNGRYITAAREKQKKGLLTNIDEILEFGPVFNILNAICEKEGIKKIGFEIPINTYRIRMIKDDYEISKIQKACDITNEVFNDILKFIKVGMTELEVARFVSDSFLKYGAQKLSFDTIVASGIRGSMPHARPSDKKIQDGDLVTIDMGCVYEGFCSDQTRTILMGSAIDKKQEEIYKIILDAQQAGIDKVRPGINAADIHKTCFDYIESKGYGPYFTHGTGHGLGIQIHEEPYASSAGEVILEPGMVITVEPGIYIPEFGGVRIEDDILVTEQGHKALTSSDRKLLSVK